MIPLSGQVHDWVIRNRYQSWPKYIYQGLGTSQTEQSTWLYKGLDNQGSEIQTIFIRCRHFTPWLTGFQLYFTGYSREMTIPRARSDNCQSHTNHHIYWTFFRNVTVHLILCHYNVTRFTLEYSYGLNTSEYKWITVEYFTEWYIVLIKEQCYSYKGSLHFQHSLQLLQFWFLLFQSGFWFAAYLSQQAACDVQHLLQLLRTLQLQLTSAIASVLLKQLKEPVTSSGRR